VLLASIQWLRHAIRSFVPITIGGGGGGGVFNAQPDDLDVKVSSLCIQSVASRNTFIRAFVCTHVSF
jgi:hypothetical protein